jgi:hypothetical protein
LISCHSESLKTLIPHIETTQTDLSSGRLSVSFEIALVLVRFDHVARFIVNGRNHGIMGRIIWHPAIKNDSSAILRSRLPLASPTG